MKKKLTNRTGAPVVDNQNTMTAGKRGPALLQDVWFLEKLAHSKTIFCGRKMAS
jgi:catalase